MTSLGHLKSGVFNLTEVKVLTSPLLTAAIIPGTTYKAPAERAEKDEQSKKGSVPFKVLTVGKAAFLS